jgi:hypothetical protein
MYSTGEMCCFEWDACYECAGGNEVVHLKILLDICEDWILELRVQNFSITLIVAEVILAMEEDAAELWESGLE